MQVRPPSNQPGSTHPRARNITAYTLLCFGLAGLILGFTFGGFIGHIPAGQTAGAPSSVTTTPAIAQHSPVVTVSPTPENQFIGDPSIGSYSDTETADGTTSYTLSAQIVDKTQKPIQVTDATCKLWLTGDAGATDNALKDNNYAIPSQVNSLTTTFPSETQGALNFTAPSQQVQPCVANGKTNWTYTLAPGVAAGNYFLAVLADWKGIHYSWYFVQITVPKANN